MKLAIYSASVGDGSIGSSIRYGRDAGIERLVVPFQQVPGYEEKGYLPLEALKQAKAEVEGAGLTFSTMTVRPELSAIHGGPGGEAHYGNLCRSLEAMGSVGADVLLIFITRDRPSNPSEVDAAWARLVDFYRRFMAQAEACGVKVAFHAAARTAERPRRDLVHDADTLERLMTEAPSPSNGICFCVGNFWLSAGEGMYDLIRRFSSKVFLAHMRSTRQGLGETPFWLDGPGPDLPRVVRTLHQVGYRGELVPEHLPSVAGENRAETGTAWAAGYLKALLQVL